MISLASLFANTHIVTAGFIRSGQPCALWLWRRLFADHAFATVVNLRGPNKRHQWYQNEIAVCAENGCRHHDLLFSSRRLPSRELLVQFLDLIENEPRPILVKCAGGAERTGLASALWLMNHGVDVAQARRQLRLLPYLHWAKREQRWLGEFFKYYAKTCGPRTLRDWLTQVYSDEAFARFMIDRGHGDYWRV